MTLWASFVRILGQPDRIYVHRSDDSEVSWTFPTYGDGLPHDLVHLVVESAFGVRRGFWGRVDSGVDPARVNAAANRRGGTDKFAPFGANLRELYLAEAMAVVRWGDVTLSDDGIVAIVRDSYCELELDVPVTLSRERVARVRETLDALRCRWCELLPKGTLRLPFDPTDPCLSFEGLRRSDPGRRVVNGSQGGCPSLARFPQWFPSVSLD